MEIAVQEFLVAEARERARQAQASAAASNGASDATGAPAVAAEP
jgi:hypothetical protein